MKDVASCEKLGGVACRFWSQDFWITPRGGKTPGIETS